MKATLGYGASTCSYADWLHADLIVLFGSNVANNQPVTTKYLHYAKKNGAQIAVVNPYREPGLARYWVPSIPSSALFGTELADHWFQVHTGGDLAFLVGVFRALVEMGGVDEAFVRERTTGFEEARDRARAADWAPLERESGVARDQMRGVCAPARGSAERHLRLVDGPHAACARRRDGQGAGERRPGARAAGAAESRPRPNPRSFGRAGRRRSRVRAESGCRDGRAMAGRLGVSAAGDARLDDVGDDRSRCRRRCRPVLDRRRQLSRNAAGRRPRPARPRRGRGCAFITTSCCPLRCSSRATETSCSSRRRRGTSRRAAARKPRPSGASSFRRRFPGGASDRRVPNGRCSARQWHVHGQSMPTRFISPTPQAVRAEIARAIPLYQGIETLHAKGRSDPVGRAHVVRGRPVRDAGRQSAFHAD